MIITIIRICRSYNSFFLLNFYSKVKRDIDAYIILHLLKKKIKYIVFMFFYLSQYSIRKSSINKRSRNESLPEVSFSFPLLITPQHRIQLRLHSENQLFARFATASAISARENIQMNF